MDLQNKSEHPQDFTEKENDLNVTNIKSNKKKVFDSDSELDEPSSKGTTESVKQFAPVDKKNSEIVQNTAAELANPLNETGNEMFNNLARTVAEEYDTEINGESELPSKAIHRKKLKRTALLNSDSEDEFNVKQLETDGEQTVNVLEKEKYVNENEDNDIKDNEEHENNAAQSSSNNDEVKVKKKLKRIAIIDSDSEDEVPVTLHNKSFNDELDTPPVDSDKSVYLVDGKGKLVAENSPEMSQEDFLKKSIAALCSSESSEDENTFATSDKELSPDTQNRAKSLKKRLTKASTEAPSGKKMTGKQALQQRQEIRSESQRMLRESRVSLPYHKPKAHSIKEFLQNRPRLSILQTNNAAPSIAMKMSVQELELVTKKLEERKKVVQEFYKSESESDEEEQSEDPKAVDNEATGDSNKEVVENKESNENTVMETSENGELAINSEDQENVGICVDPKMGENIKETVHEPNMQHGEANFGPSQMKVDVNIHENVSDTTEKNYDNENQEMNVTEEKIDTDISNSDVDGQMILNKNDEFPVAEPNNSDLEKNKSIICQDDVITDEAQEKPPISPAVPETSSTNPAEMCKEIQDSSKEQNNIPEHCEDSVDFDFNLDGLDEDFSESFPEDSENISAISEKISESKEKGTEEEHLQRLLQKYEDVSNDDCIKLALATEKKINKIDLLKQIGPIKPCLSGGPDEIIDLDEGTSKPSEVAKLMERFMKHALPKHVTKSKVQLDIINLTQGEVIKETVAMSVDPEEEPVAIVETPGIKLKKLRDELQSQMAQRRSELWQQKHHPFGETVNKETDEKSDCGADEDILDDDEEAELTDIEDEEDEESEEEYEQQHSKKLETPRVKSAFIDEEAEETDDGDDEALINDDECDADEECSADELDEKEKRVKEDTAEIQNITIKKPLRRILKGFTEDSDEEENSQSVLNSQIVNESDRENKNASFTSLNSTDSMDDDDVPPNQPRTDKTPHKDRTQSKTAVLGLLTPVQHLTGLRGFNSGSKFLVDESPVSPFLLPPDPSPLKDNNWNKNLQKKLFADSCDTFDSETNMEDIAQLCSGEFLSQVQEVAGASTACSIPAVETLATQDVISMCSGSFPGITAAPKDHQEKCFDNALLTNQEANIETDTFKNKGPIEQLNLNSNEEIKSLDDDDQLISEILDEEELEQFKKKFESPTAPVLSNVDDCDMEVKGGGKLLSDSSDNEDEEPKNKKSMKKLQKRLAYSDDSETEDDANVDEEINLHDDYSDDEFDDNDAKTDKVIDYDSEENEIELDNQDGIPRPKCKPSDFVENEAELSESDWDSADEDEKGLDTLEFEQGDAEVFDENKMRSDLEKIHMRRVLDQDNQEIKILQELLLEDGELHGTGRQRQFKWRNIDDAENEDGQKDAEIEAYLDEEESEEQWRRARHQREMFLKEKQQKHVSLENEDFISTDSDSQVLKLGQEAVRKSLSAAPVLPEKPSGTTASPEVKKPLMLLTTRGSFLARTDKFLSRLADFTKVSTITAGGPPKTANKFVFQTVSQSTMEAGLNNNKRKLENADKTPKIIKKLRLSSNLTPVVKNVDKKKKLF